MKSWNLLDLSGALQNATSHLLRKRQEVFDSKNAAYNIRIGSAVRRFGYEQVGDTIQYGQDSLFGGVFLHGDGNTIITGINNAGASAATLRFMDSSRSWQTIWTTTVNTRFQAINYLDEYYVAGRAGDNGYQSLINIDSTLVPSQTRNVNNSPACRYIAQYGGRLYALNCQINGVTYRDRAYLSSAAIGAITFIQTDQTGTLTQLTVNSVRYLKVGMVIDIYQAGTETALYTNIVITAIDKKNNKITFGSQSITVSNNDEVWLNGRKGKLSIFWNTDYPTPESSDWFRIPSGEDEAAAFTGWTVNNNRLLLFSRNSLMKWDGQNLVVISPAVGCVNHESIVNIGAWTFWLHTTGVWGYNDNIGQIKLISKAITPIIQRITPTGFSKASGVASGRVYKLAIGQLMDPLLATTSTSTSSTSSTSTSSTSSSTTTTTTATTTSTSTTTTPTGKTAVRLCYDFDLNIWWYEEHNREFRFQFMHSMNGLVKPYFTDENGYLFRDETGFTDFGLSIPMTVETGRVNCGTEQNKTWMAVQVDSERARGAILQYSLDNDDTWLTLSQLTEDIQTVPFPQANELIQSRDINFRVVHNEPTDPPFINGLTVYFNIVESLVNEIGEN